MSSIFSGTRLAFLAGENPKARSIYADEVPVDAAAKSSSPKAKRNALLKYAWVVLGLLTVLIPLIVRNARMNSYQNNAWQKIANQYNEYQQQYAQNQYQNGQGQNQQNQNGQNQQYQNGQGQEAEGKRFYDVNNCKWYNFGCNPYYVDEKGEYVSEYEMQQEMYRQEMEQKQQQYEQQQEYYENQGQNQYNGQQGQNQYNGQQAQNQNNGQQGQGYYDQQGQAYGQQGQGNWYGSNSAAQNMERSKGLRFVYGFQIILWTAIVAYGYHVLHNGKELSCLLGVLAVWIVFNFLAIFMLRNGAVMQQGQVNDLAGYYGQFAVLMFMTDVWYAGVGLLFAIVLGIKHAHDPRPMASEGTQAKGGQYQAPVQPPASNGEGDDYVKVV